MANVEKTEFVLPEDSATPAGETGLGRNPESAAVSPERQETDHDLEVSLRPKSSRSG